MLSGALALASGAGVTSKELAPYLVPTRAGDPLGLGLAPGERPPAPADPDKYSREEEDKHFARSLIPEAERKKLDEEITKNGYMTIAEVRNLVKNNALMGSVEAGGLDAEIMALIDARIDYKIFVAGDNIYTRDELYASFAFHEFNVQPEAIFTPQEIGIFPPRTTALQDDLEYVARDVGDETVEFVMIEDLVGQVTRDNYKMRREPLRIVKTKIYIGKENWDNFLLMQRFYTGMNRITMAQIAYGGSGAAAPAVPRAGPLAIEDAARVEASRAALAEEMRRREEELRRREEELRRREEERRRHEEEVARKIAADVRRIEEMLSKAAELRRNAEAGGKKKPAPAAPAQPAADDDSVPL